MDVMIDDCSISQLEVRLLNFLCNATKKPTGWLIYRPTYDSWANALKLILGHQAVSLQLFLYIFSGVLPLYKQREARQQHCHRRFAHHRLFYFVYFSRFACVFRVLLMWRYDESGFTKLQINYIIVVLVERLGPAKSNHSYQHCSFRMTWAHQVDSFLVRIWIWQV